MEHNPFMTLTDDTEITYSDLKKDMNSEYITIYFETPSEEFGFCSMEINYPDGKPLNIVGYKKEDVSHLLYHYYKIGDSAFEEAKKKLVHNKAESIEDSFGKYQISDIHQGDYVRFWWRWVSKTGKNRIHEGIVLAVNSYDRKCPTLDVMSEGILYNNIEIYFVIECFDGGKHYE